MKSQLRRLLLLGVGVFFLSSCGVDGSSDAEPVASPPVAESGESSGEAEAPTTPEVKEFDKVSMITQITDEVFIKNYASLNGSAALFSEAEGSLKTYCDSIGTDQELSARDAAQEQWRVTMADVQATEMHAFGPVAENGGALRNRVHSYDFGTLSTCGIDQAVVLAEGDGFDISTRSINQRGMSAIEYLIFNTDLNHTCASQVPETQSWNTRPDSERRAKRCDLAVQVAKDVAAAAREIDVEWQAYRTGFIKQDNAGESLQLITDGLFALDKLTKDKKINVPLGLIDECSARTCPKLVESQYAENSYANVRANLLSFKKIFSGGEGFGFDDFIDNEGFPEVSLRVIENINATVAVVDAAEVSIRAEVASISTVADETACSNAFAAPDQPSQLNACRLAGSIKRITDDLKIDFVTIVGVMIPDSAQSDND